MRIYLALLLILQLSCLTLAQNDKVVSVPAAVAEKHQDDFLKNPETPVKSEPVIKGAVITPDKAEKIVKDEQKKVPVNDESKKILVKDEPKKVPELIKELAKEEVKKGPVKEDVKKEPVKEEFKKEPVKEEVNKSPIKEDVKKESVKEVKKETVKEDVKKKPVKEEVKTKAVEKEPLKPIEIVKSDVKKEDKVDVKNDEIKKDENKKEDVKKQDEEKTDETVVEDNVFNDPINENDNVSFPGQLRNGLPWLFPAGSDCTVVSNGIETPGACLNFAQCTLYGGSLPPAGATLKNTQSCSGIVSQCCTSVQKCGGTINTKVGSFLAPTTTTTTTGFTCSSTVKLFHGNICQIRLDFDQFTLQTGVQDGTKFLCTADSFTVDSGLNMPPMCGCNTGQHVYLYLNPNSINSFTLTVKTAARPSVGNTLITNPTWSIRVTQLECPQIPSRRSIDNPQGISDPVFSLVNGKTVSKQPRNNFAGVDSQSLAPYNALQYFTGTTGTIRSFGYLSTCASNFFITNDNDYAVCIKRPAGICSVELKVVRFDMGLAMGTPTLFGTTDCTAATGGKALDWLDFLEAKYISTLTTDIGRVCGGFKAGDIIKITNPGPFCFVVHRPFQPNPAALAGFEFTYNLIGC